MNEQLTTFIIKELGRRYDRKEIIQKVCERGGLNWKEAERLITLVEARHRHKIAVQQSPMLLFLSIAALILGIWLLAINLQLVMAFFEKDLLGQVFSLQSTAYRVIGVLTGFGMTIGGLLGMWNAFGTIFPEE
jgi:hypothetical protein